MLHGRRKILRLYIANGLSSNAQRSTLMKYQRPLVFGNINAPPAPSNLRGGVGTHEAFGMLSSGCQQL